MRGFEPPASASRKQTFKYFKRLASGDYSHSQ
jgi:hypothetical protein